MLAEHVLWSAPEEGIMFPSARRMEPGPISHGALSMSLERRSKSPEFVLGSLVTVPLTGQALSVSLLVL